jgi:hypothetical protein
MDGQIPIVDHRDHRTALFRLSPSGTLLFGWREKGAKLKMDAGKWPAKQIRGSIPVLFVW